MAAPEPPRSAAVRRLDELIEGLLSSESTPSASRSQPKTQNKSATEDRDACFCQGKCSFFQSSCLETHHQSSSPLIVSFSYHFHFYAPTPHPTHSARVHALSEYTPICTHCGLILCTHHYPHRPCPHCTTPLLTPPARSALIAQLEELRAQTLAEEEAGREREKEALRVAEGAFPVLGGPQRTPSAPAVGTTAGGRGGAGHRVLSVDPRTKRVVVGSYTGFSRRTAGHGEDEEGEEERDVQEGERVPPQPREVEYVRVQRGPATRWIDLKGGASGGATAKYVAPPPLLLPPLKQLGQRDGR